MKRTLTLHRETIAPLTTAELAGVAGAGPDPTQQPTPPQYVVTHTCFETKVVCATSPYLTQGPSCDYC